MKENNTTIYGNIHFDNKWICISNHKVASTTLSCVLKKNGGFGKRDWYEVDVNQFNFIFTFVRNPYDRIVSRFLHLKRRIGEINGLIDEDETKQSHADKNLLSKFFSNIDCNYKESIYLLGSFLIFFIICSL